MRRCCSSRDQLQDARLHGHVERGRRLVGDQQIGIAGERLGDHHALPHAAGELVRIALHDLARVRDLRLGERRGDHARRRPPRSGCGGRGAAAARAARARGCASAARPAAAAERRRAIGLRTCTPARVEDVGGPVLVEHLGDLIADRERRVERLAGILEDHGDAVAAERPHRASGCEQIRSPRRSPHGGSPSRRSRAGRGCGRFPRSARSRAVAIGQSARPEHDRAAGVDAGRHRRRGAGRRAP